MRTKYALTGAQQQACAWLAEHNGDGVFVRSGRSHASGVLLAAGEIAPIMRSTWNKLRDLGHVTITEKRVALTVSGFVVAALKRFDELYPFARSP